MRNVCRWKTTTLAVCVLGSTLGFSASAVQAGGFTVEGCLAAKAKAWNKLRACERAEAVKGVLAKPADASRCRAKFTAALAKAQDKADSVGAVCRFQDNGDGTVTDFDTGLMWARLTQFDGVPSTYVLDADNTYDWGSALGVAAVLNGVSVGGAPPISASGFPRYDDWRLPSITELRSIVDCVFGSPCFRPELGVSRLGKHYWSSSVDAQNSTIVWRVFSTGGAVGVTGKGAAECVRPVRTAW